MREKRKRVVQKRGSRFHFRPILFCLLFIAVVATPVFFLVGFIYNRLLMAISQYRLKKGQSTFWLTSEQSMAYLKKNSRYNELRKLLASAEGEAKLTAVDEYKPEIDSLGRELEQLQSLPLENWKKFREVVARTNAFVLCFIIWCGVVLYFHWPVAGNTVAVIMDEYIRLALFLPDLVGTGGDPQPLGSDVLWAAANAAFWPIVLYFPVKQVAGMMVSFYAERPPAVNFGSVFASLDSGKVKAVFVASAPQKVEPMIEILDDPGAFEPEGHT